MIYSSEDTVGSVGSIVMYPTLDGVALKFVLTHIVRKRHKAKELLDY